MRVSNDLQNDNHTFETQESLIRRKLDSVYGAGSYDIKFYQDEGLSGAFGPRPTGVEKRTRPNLVLIENDLRSGSYDAMAVYHTNRLYRSERWALEFLEDVMLPSGVEYLAAREPCDIKTSEGQRQFVRQAREGGDYRHSCATRIRDAFSERSEAGFPLGLPPYGWRYEPRQDRYPSGRRGFIRNDEHTETLLLMKDRYLAGINSIRIAGELNERGIPSPRGKRWMNKTVLDTLRNPIHAGLIKNAKDKSLKEGLHSKQRYWDPATRDEILDICKKRVRTFKTNTGKRDSPYVVNGIASCARCGRRLYPRPGLKYRGYYCSNGKGYGGLTCPDTTIRAEMLERVVVNEMENAALDPTIRQILVSAAERITDAEDETLEKERQALERQLKSLKGKKEILIDNLAEGVITKSRFKETELRYDQEGGQAEQRLEQINKSFAGRLDRRARAEKIQQAILDFPLCWKEATLDERRHLMLTLIEKLTIKRSGRNAVVTLKIHLLPEREISVMFESARHIKEKPLGVESLTPRQLAYLHYIGLGKTNQEIASLWGTGIANVYTYAMYVRRALGIRDLQEAYKLAHHRIEQQLAFLPLGATGGCTLKPGGPQNMAPCLKEVLPLLARGASYTEVARRTGLTPDAVSNRRKRILEIFDTKSIFEAGERARAMRLLDDVSGSERTPLPAGSDTGTRTQEPPSRPDRAV
jgi:DNA-binding NarL/FixJ family response regulator